MSVARKGVVLLLLVRCATFSVGCGPADGQLGGKCLTDDSGCSRDGRCNQGQCEESTNTCEETGSATVFPTPPQPTIQTCNFGPLYDCPDDEIAVVCDLGQPFPAGVRTCRLKIPDDQDASGFTFCCELDDAMRAADASSSFLSPFVDE